MRVPPHFAQRGLAHELGGGEGEKVGSFCCSVLPKPP